MAKIFCYRTLRISGTSVERNIYLFIMISSLKLQLSGFSHITDSSVSLIESETVCSIVWRGSPQANVEGAEKRGRCKEIAHLFYKVRTESKQ